MNSDEFEKRLQQQTIRKIPTAWRREILDATKTESVAQSSARNSQPNSWWRELLWPCPQAWAGLATVWVVIFAMSYTAQEPETKLAKAPPPSPEYIMALKEQRRLYLELTELHPKETAEPNTSTPGPRSEREKLFKIV